MTVVEHQFHGVLPHGFDGANADILFTEHQDLLAGPVTLHLGRG